MASSAASASSSMAAGSRAVSSRRRRRRRRRRCDLKTEPFEDRERRAYALSVLDSPEQLMMFAQSANDSIPSQRLRFSAILAGFEPVPTTADGRRQGPAPRRDVRAKARRGPSERHDVSGEWAD
ncbi:hypothetical protein HIM_05527 [Hirsutella minnesotensis 3608]|uniref:Uncharacterized protein n=1 Tax=Hirsutella minnesotensis 3608 TaxID=1043627 RepID=A0A0F7ZK80_9HYPO|nr:hypothetical protein HIM_05527 [Hirsutella minnesotensis 3608]